MIWRPPGETFWRGGRYHVFLSDDVCVGHGHIPPTEAEVARTVTQAENEHATIALHVNVQR